MTGSYSNFGTSYIKNFQIEIGSAETAFVAYNGGSWEYDAETGNISTPAMTSLTGTNYIWSDGGDVTAEYGAFLTALQAEIDGLDSRVTALETVLTAAL